MKTKILLIIALLIALVEGARGQIYINSYRFGVAANPVLDDYPNSGAAFSFRLLRTAYTGNCIMVRRSSNGDSTNIGFVNNYLDTAALKTFCSGTNCTVRVWYDQSGNARNAQQTINANQPQIVNNGVVNYRAGDVGLVFDGTNDDLIMPADSLTRNTGFVNVFTYINVNSFNTGAIFYSSTSTTSSTRTGLFAIATTNTLSTIRRRLDADASGTISSSGLSTNTAYLFTSLVQYTNNSISQYVNNTIDGTGTTGTSGNTSDTNSEANYIGSLGALANFFNGTIHEIIVYQTDQSSNRSNINTNINTFYSIY